MTQKLSVIVITRNEEHDIAACLDSVKGLADEIVVIDSGSTDKTLEICRRYTSNVSHQDFLGYGPQKQRALEKAQGPWILNIDADERVTPALAQEIRAVLSSEPDATGFNIPFNHYFLGTHLRFGGSAGEKHIRLFRKDSASYGKDQVHEVIQVNGRIVTLRHSIEHHSYRDLTEYLEKCNHYTSLIAAKKHANGERFHVWQHLRLPYEFAVRYVLKLGFLDGSPGFAYALLSSYYVWLKFMKLRDFEIKNT
jgi:glycosyltransferase involved in cell wall biosynthesis